MRINSIRTTSNEIAKVLRPQVLALFAILAASVFVCAQPPEPQSPNRGAKLGNGYSVSDFETINTTSGNLMLNFPLGSLPTGRGGVSAGVYLTYNSQMYNMRSEKMDDERIDRDFFNKTIIERDINKGGWQIGSMYRLEFENKRFSYGEYPPQCGYVNEINDEVAYINKVRMVFPDGSTHEMIPYGHYDKKGDRYFNVDINGVQFTCAGGASYGDRPVYYSLDGTYVRLETQSAGEWTLYFPDGSKVVQNTSQQRLYDRNGNYVNLAYNGVSDQLGRSVTISTVGDETHITSQGFNDNDDIVWKIRYKNQVVRKTYQAVPNNQNYPGEHHVAPLTVHMGVVAEIQQPSQMGGGIYQFNYNGLEYTTTAPTGESSGWGEISQITLPSSATINYKYVMDDNEGPVLFDEVKSILRNYPYEKDLSYNTSYDGNTAPVTEKWLYSISFTGSSVTGPDGGVTTTEFGQTDDYAPFTPYVESGLALKTVGPEGSKTENLWARNLPTPCTFESDCVSYYGYSQPPKPDNTYIEASFTSLKDSGGNYTTTVIKEFTYDKNGNVTEVKEYDGVPHSSIPRHSQNYLNGHVSGMPSGVSSYLKRITRTEYYNPTPEASDTSADSDVYIHAGTTLNPAKKVLRLPKSTKVMDASEAIKAYSEITYDHTNYDSSNTKAGNPTLTRMWDSAKSTITYPLTDGNSVKSQATYNSYGMPLTTTDANGNVTNITYGCIDGNILTTCTVIDNLYPTKVETAYGTAVQRTTSSIYDFYTGLVKSTTDEDNDLTVATDYDDLGRPVEVITAPGRPGFESKVETEYDDGARKIVVRADLEVSGDGKKVSSQFFDEIGRVRLTKTLEDATTQSATNETDGIKVQTRYKTTYSSPNGYSYQLTSNPYRANYSSNAGSEETMGWTLAKSWHTGKKQTIETFSGAGLPAAFGGSDANSTGVVTTEVDTFVTTVEDQAGKKRRSIMNGFGQLIRVDEPDGSGALGTVSSPNQDTGYVYDILGNLKTVDQGDQERTFTYSSLSRLLSANNPESGTISYQYDDNGNLRFKTDARSIQTEYEYDQLNRVKTREYTSPSPTPANYQATPTVTYTYDDKQFAKGKLTKVSSSVSTTEYTEFDELGRVKAHKQTTDGNDYVTGYTYNLSGALIEQAYPTGRVVKNTLDVNGDLSQVLSKKNAGSLYWGYASSFTYNPVGAVTSMELGNGNWESTKFNARLQPTEIALGTTPGATNLLNLDYTYGTWVSSTLDEGKNNGNVARQVISVETVGANTGFTATQKYLHDHLNRLTDATETVSGQSWRQAFVYDRYGNRNFDEVNTSTSVFDPLKSCTESSQAVLCAADRKKLNPSVNTANNKFNTGQDYTYDAGGSITEDANSQSYIYDGENKMVQALDANDDPLGTYYYDGDGKRVKKVVPNGETTIFVYDASGKMIGEYSTQLNPTQQVSYLTTDTLGSPRINTDENGAVISRHDYHPFGDEIVGSGGRTQGLSYQSDDIRKQFTGYERDEESGLDFAQARMYGYGLGRFTSPDPLAASANSNRPQSWNRYTYSYNNPLRFTDPSGMVAGDFYNMDGEKIGTNGDEKDEAIYLVHDKKRIKEIEKTSGNYTGSVEGTIKLPNAEIVTVVDNAITRSDGAAFNGQLAANEKATGGFAEAAATWKTVDGKTTYTATENGPVTDPRIKQDAHVTVPSNVDGQIHVHPNGEIVRRAPLKIGNDPVFSTGSKPDGGGKFFFDAPPSQKADIKNASAGTNIVVGGTGAEKNRNVYFYSQKGEVAKMSLSNFRRVGR